MKPFYLAVVILASSVILANATAGVWSGRLLEKGSARPLENVNIFLLPAKLKATTGVAGTFQFDLDEINPIGPCQIIINLTGYRKFEQSLNCSAVAGLPATLYLEKIRYSSYETTVTSKVVRRDQQAKGLAQEEFLQAPGSFGGDPVRAAQNLAGVGSNGASAQIIIQGAEADDTGHFIDGAQIPLIFHFGGLSSVIVPEAVENLELLPSGYGPEYSRFLGGIVNLTTQTPTPERWKTIAYLDLLNAGGITQGPINDRSGILVAGRYSYIGQVLQLVASDSEDFALTAAPTYYDFTTVHQVKLSPATSLKTTLLVSEDNLALVLNKNASNDPALSGDVYSRIAFGRLIPQLTVKLSESTSMRHSLAVGYDQIFFDIDGQYLDIKTKNLDHRSEITYQADERYQLFWGLDNQCYWGKVRINLPSTYSAGGVANPFSSGEFFTFSEQANACLVGSYLRQNLKWEKDSPWTWSPNLRWDYLEVTGESIWQLRGQITYQWDPSFQMRLAAGQYLQLPEPAQTSIYYGNPHLRALRADHYQVGWSKDFRGNSPQGFEISNNYFYKTLGKLVTPSPQDRYQNQGTGEIIGSEVQAKWANTSWSWTLAYTYLKSKRTLPGKGTFPAAADQTHQLNLLGSFRYERWSFGSRWRWITGKPYTPVLGSIFDSNNDVFIPLRGPLYSQRYDNFFQIDLRIDRQFVFNNWLLTAYLDVQNLTNTANPQSLQYSYDYTQKNAVQGLPILPTLGVKGEF